MRSKELGLWRDVTWNEYRDRVGEIAQGLRALGLEKGDRVSVIGDNCPEWVTLDLGIQCAGGVTVGVYATSAWQQCEFVVGHSESAFLVVENAEQLDKWLTFRERVPSLKKVIVWDLEGLRGFEDPMVMSYEELLELDRGGAAAKDVGSCCEPAAAILERCAARIDPHDTAMIVYTSGTTGPPKGAMLSHANVVWVAETVADLNPAWTLTEDDEVLSFLPLCHIFERLFSVLLHVTRGYTVSFVESPETISENMREMSPTVGYGVPRLWEKYQSSIVIRMQDATWLKRTAYALALRAGRAHAGRRLGRSESAADGPGRPGLALEVANWLANFLVFRKLKERLGFDKLRVALTGAAPIAPEVLLFFQSIGVNLVEGYGQTESSGVISGVIDERIRLGTVGLPIEGLEAKLAEDGEILVRSPGVFQGYFKDDEATREALRDGWLNTGDIGEIDSEGFLRIVDRKKDLIITAGGKNIAPQYIENKLKFSPYINDAVVIGDRRKFLTALVILDEDNVAKYAQDNKIPFSTYAELADDPGINELIQAEVEKVNSEVSRVEKIRKFRILPKRLYEEDGEVTPTMKVKRSSINLGYADLIESMYAE